MTVSFIDIQQQALENFGLFIGVVHFQTHIRQLGPLNNSDSTVYSHGRVMSGDEKYQPCFRIAFYVLITVEQLVPRYIRYEQLSVVQHFDESGRTAFRRGIAIGIARRQNAKRHTS